MSSYLRRLEVELEAFCWLTELDTKHRIVAQVHSLSGETLQGSDDHRQDEPPLASPLQQVHHAVRNHVQHRKRPAIGLAASSVEQVYWESNICPTTTINTDKHHLKGQLISTRVAFSTADVRRALRQLAAIERDHNQRARFISVGSTPFKATATSVVGGGGGSTRQRRSKRPAELSPCRMAATTKIKSSYSARDRDKLKGLIGRDDPQMAHFRGDQLLGEPQGGHCAAGQPNARSLMKVTPDGVVPDSEPSVRFDESCLPIGASERDDEVCRCERNLITSCREENKFAARQDEESSPIGPSYANGQRHKEHSVGGEQSANLSRASIGEEVLNQRNKSKTSYSNSREKRPNQADMTTESFVPTDSIGQHINSNNLNSEHDETRHQYNIISQHQHPARPIGLACSTSSCSLTSAHDDDDDDDDRDQQVSSRSADGPHIEQLRSVNELANGDRNNNSIKAVNNMKSADEKYTVISASSLVSLSDEQHYGQSYLGGRGCGGASVLASSSSTNAINQSRSNNGNKNLIGKLVGKKASRIRELVLQNLGRADRTTDELFDLYEMNFYKQQQHVQQLTKEFKLYTNALKSYHEASRSLSKCIQQSTSDYQLARHDLVCDNLSQLDQLNEDLMEKLQEKVVKSLGDYLTRFDEIKEKINKRHRKLIDYDSSRRLYELMFARVSKKRSSNTQQQQPQHNYQSILRGIKFLSQQQQQSSAMGQHNPNQESVIASQLVDEARLLKLREQFNYCKLMYENINGELQDELPVVYETKMKSLLNALRNYCDIRAHHHSNVSKLIAKVSDVMTVANGQSVGDETNTILSMYDDGTDEKSSSAGRRMNSTGPGSGSSGVSVSGSASRSSGSSLASPDCDGQHPSGLAADGDGGEDDGGEGANDDNNQQRDSKNEQGPADLDNSVRQFVEVSLESVGKQDDEPLQAGPSGGAVACEQVSGGSDSVEEQANTQSSDRDQNIRDDNEAVAGPGKDESKEVGSVEVGCKINNDIVTDVEAGLELLVVKSGGSPITSMGYNDSDATAVQKEYLYRVRTNYKYLAEDVDELCFEANEIIQVIEFDENHEPEDGWLLGIREVNNQRGLFPANFTQPI